jgi:hypothetical protein
MARFPLYDVITIEDETLALRGLPGAVYQVVRRSDGSITPIFGAEEGGTGTTDPQVVDAKGRFGIWLDTPGQYNLVVTPPTGPVAVMPFDIADPSATGGPTNGNGGGPVTIPPSFKVEPTDVQPGISITPHTGGYFMDFAIGAPGCPITALDRPSTYWFDTVSGQTNLYANDVTLAPMNMMAKLTSNGAVAGSLQNLLTISNQGYSPRQIDFGRLYFYLDDPVPASAPLIAAIRLVSYTTDGLPVALGISGGATPKWAVWMGDTVVGTGSVNVTGQNMYRVEWCLTGAYTGSGSIEVRVYNGHGTTPVETFTITSANAIGGSFAWGLNTDAATFGNTKGADLKGKFMRLGAIATGCTDWAGPYRGRQSAFEITTPDRSRPTFEVLPGGDTVVRASEAYTLASGGTANYLVQPGDIVCRFHSRGLQLGQNKMVGNPAGQVDTVMTDIVLDLVNLRISARGLNIRILNDPPDLIFARGALFDTATPGWWKAGNSLTLAAGSALATFAPGDIVLTDRDRGHGIAIDDHDGPFTVTPGTPAIFNKVANDLSQNSEVYCDVTSGTPPYNDLGALTVDVPTSKFTKTAHGLHINEQVVFAGTTLPTPLVAGTNYWVVSNGLTANDFQVSASKGGAPITLGGTASGVTAQAPLVDGYKYFICINKTADTFRLSATKGANTAA